MHKPSAYQDVATIAAKLELNGNYARAAEFWQTARRLAKNTANEFWSQTRAELCVQKANEILSGSFLK
ncbi:ANR family transcriptional regulator [Enterobacter kobei]|uniref:ANR family transcriptional regulator n=1 Tax=Enterobacter kobei TaxID=208224 RepID=UPI003CED9CC9